MAMTRAQNGTLRVVGWAVVIAIAVFGGVLAWSRVDAAESATQKAQLADHERRILAVEAEVKKIGPMYWLVSQMAAQDGIELPKE